MTRGTGGTLRPVRHGVVPAAGLGTRFLPISRTVPKELLPLVDTPVIELVVSELASAGIRSVVVVIAPGKESIGAYFSPSPRLEQRLLDEGRQEELELLRRPERLAQVRIVVQREPKGNGHAVLQAREVVGDEPFAMLWGDDIVLGPDPAVAQLIAARERLGGGSVVGCVRVGRSEVGRYGVIDGTQVDARTFRVRTLIEKPTPEEAPSDLAAVHGYVLESEVFEVLARQPPGRHGEIWLTDAVSALARDGAPVWAVELQGRRHDAGDRLGYVNAFVEAALARPDLAPGLRDHLRRSGWRAPGDR